MNQKKDLSTIFLNSINFKGQLIGEIYFSCLQFSQKTNESNSTWGTIVVKLNFFIRFLGELKIPKRYFEFNWPLKLVKTQIKKKQMEIIILDDK